MTLKNEMHFEIFVSKQMRSLKVYTDGACKGNPGIGGWGVVIYDDNFVWTSCGGKKKTTNQEMELQAVNQALRICPEGCDIEIIADTMYVLQGLVSGGKSGTIERNKNGKIHFSGWTGAWRAKGWVKADGGAIKHLELWKEIVQRCETHVEMGSKLTLTWIKGHSGDKENDKADELANLGIKKFQ